MFAIFWDNSQVRKAVKSSYSACRSALTGENIKSFFSTPWEKVSAYLKALWAKLTNIVTNKDGNRPIVDRVSNMGQLLWDELVELPLFVLYEVIAMTFNVAWFCVTTPFSGVCHVVVDAKVLLSMPYRKVVEMIDSRKDEKVEQQDAA
tara:strand:+ start:1121 stop:1564 length:444 start_codon:yes stop_codon:yes gene_type:complete